MAGPPYLRGGHACQYEDAGADDVADAEHDKRGRAEHPLQRVAAGIAGLCLQRFDRLGRDQRSQPAHPRLHYHRLLS